MLTTKLKVLLVDDELPARQELRFILEKKFPDKIDIIGEAEHGCAAVEKVKKNNPEIVFLDIHMPGINGLEVAQIIVSINPEIMIVFITAYDHYALKAFEINTLDYLVKPISIERLEKTMSRIFERKDSLTDFQNKKIEELINQLDNLLPTQKTNKIPCEEYGRFILVKDNEILYCKSEEGKVKVFTKDKKLETFYTLNELEEKLGFFRAHRSYLVNLEHIKVIEPYFHGCYQLIIDNYKKTEIPVSRMQSKRLREILDL